MIFSESMTLSHDPLAGSQRPQKDIFDKIVGAAVGETPVEGNANKVVDAVGFEENRFFLERRKNRKIRIRKQNRPGMGLEGDDDAGKTGAPGAAHDILHERIVSLMDAVEISHGNDAAADGKIRGFIQSDDFHNN
jgi:hypothetical protein